MITGPQELADRARVAVSALPGIVAAYLFGSVAEHRIHRESDVDIGVLLDRARFPTSRDRFECGLTVAAALASALRRNDIDLVVLNDAPPHLARAIVSAGLCLFVADPEAERSFRRTAMLLAADLEPFLRRTRRTKLAALTRPAARRS